LAICLLLLGFAFHGIFMHEGRMAWEASGRHWDDLSRSSQWLEAWVLGPVGLWNTILLLRPMDGVLSLVFMGMTIVAGLFRWHLFLSAQGLGLSLGRTAEISFVAHFFNSVLLGSAGGDLMKALYAARETHHLKAESVMTVVVDRLVGLFATLFFAALMMIPNLDLLRTHGRLAAVSGVVLGSLAIVTVVVVLSFWGGLSRLWPNARNMLAKVPKGALVERSLLAARGFGKRPGTLLTALAWSMLLNSACVLQIWALTRGLGVHVPLRWLMVIIPTVVFLSSIPITPNGLGVRENLYVWMLTVPEIGVPATTALSLSLLAFAGSLLWSLVGGVVYLKFRRQHHLLEVAQASESEEQTPSAPPESS
jgi:uncharacterized membrane protein YbhN (UPF0104 family)